jgi:transglutaminase-like putative cysteine protease/tetratricopeptide (TPR) repeat protein
MPDLFPLPWLTLWCVLALGGGLLMGITRVRIIPASLVSLALPYAIYQILLLVGTLQDNSDLKGLVLRFHLTQPLILLCMYLSFITSILWVRNKRWKLIEPLLGTLVFALSAWSQGNHRVTIFSHPLYFALFAGTFAFLSILRMLLDSNRNYKTLLMGIPLLPLLVGISLYMLSAFNALSVSNNGGLIQPTLLRFDFSPYLTLQEEIRVNDSMVLVLKTDARNAFTFLKRTHLSGWDEKKGFFEELAPGEEAELREVPKQETQLPNPNWGLRFPAEQEYFIVNFDTKSLIAMDYPLRVKPYHMWNSSSFNSAYGVTSNITGFMPFELFDASAPRPGIDMSTGALDFYTRIDEATRSYLSPLAISATENRNGYYDRIQALVSFLREGDYTYSLKPGVATDGNQLRHFLYVSKKGYCTYYAFSLCLMLRSLGIPSRIAAGFFTQPDSGVLDYYPVRANMAHAWVEVFFPNYGWISFDPTSTKLAPGENISLGGNPGGDEFFTLLEEILDNRNLLVPATGDQIEEMEAGSIFRRFQNMLLTQGKWLLATLFGGLLLVFLLYRYKDSFLIRVSRKPRRIILCAESLILRRYKVKPTKGFQGPHKEAIEEIHNLAQRARFAPDCGPTQADRAKALWKALKKWSSLLWLCFFFLFFPQSQYAQENQRENYILTEAKASLGAENWEAAITWLNQGITEFPNNPYFRFELGSLFQSQKMYSLAYSQLKEAKRLSYPHPELLTLLSDTAAYLSLDEEALAWNKEYLAILPENQFAWASFGWLCYKTHRIDEGITGLLYALDKFGEDGTLLVGLGNLYAAAFNYESAKLYYSRAIHRAETEGLDYHAAIFYYNRSILEESFYHFDNAFTDTEKAQALSRKASGHLMQGELNLRRLAYSEALDQYSKAYELDSTPLATLGMADTLLRAGYPDEAWAYLSALSEQRDNSWISNYGTTLDQFNSDIQKLHHDYYVLKASHEKRKITHSLSTGITRLFHLAMYSTKAWYHNSMYHIYMRQVAHHYEHTEKTYNQQNTQEIFLNAFSFLAFKPIPSLARPYLARAEGIETSHIPEARASYLFEKGCLEKNATLLDESIGLLNPEWEKEYLAQALAERIRLTPRRKHSSIYSYYVALMDIHPALFLTHDLRLPIRIDSALPRGMKKNLFQCGFTLDPQSPFQVLARVDQQVIHLSLVNTHNAKTIYAQDFHMITQTSTEQAEFIHRFSTAIFRLDIGLK